MKLLIRNLNRDTTEAELNELFAFYGTVQSCSLVLDRDSGVSKGFGFVEMPKAGDAKAAMKNLNGTTIAGNVIRVKKAEAKLSGDTAHVEINAEAEAGADAEKVKKTKAAVVESPQSGLKPTAARPRSGRSEGGRSEGGRSEGRKRREGIAPKSTPKVADRVSRTKARGKSDKPNIWSKSSK